MTPYRPYFSADGNKVVRMWDEPFVDRRGNRAKVCKVEYIDKKGKPHEAVFWVKWLEQ